MCAQKENKRLRSRHLFSLRTTAIEGSAKAEQEVQKHGFESGHRRREEAAAKQKETRIAKQRYK